MEEMMPRGALMGSHEGTAMVRLLNCFPINSSHIPKAVFARCDTLLTTNHSRVFKQGDLVWV